MGIDKICEDVAANNVLSECSDGTYSVKMRCLFKKGVTAKVTEMFITLYEGQDEKEALRIYRYGQTIVCGLCTSAFNTAMSEAKKVKSKKIVRLDGRPYNGG